MEVETLLATWQAAFSPAARCRSGCTGIYDGLLLLTSVLVLRDSVPHFHGPCDARSDTAINRLVLHLLELFIAQSLPLDVQVPFLTM